MTKRDAKIVDFDICLANCGWPALVAQVTVSANSLAEAEALALDSDFDDLEWTDDLGNVVPWEEVDDQNVVVAVNS